MADPRPRGGATARQRWVSNNFGAKQLAKTNNGGLLPESAALTYDEMPEEQAAWSSELLPDVLFYLRKPSEKEKGTVEEIEYNGKTLRDFKVLPKRIPVDVEGWRVEAWRRLDPRITYRDIVDRMVDDPEYGEGKGLKKPGMNALQVRCSRSCRKVFGYWTDYNRREDPHRADVETIEKISYNNVVYNTLLPVCRIAPGRLTKMRLYQINEDGKFYVEPVAVTKDNLAETTVEIDHFIKDGRFEMDEAMMAAWEMSLLLQERAEKHGKQHWSRLHKGCLPPSWCDRVQEQHRPNIHDTYDGGCEICSYEAVKPEGIASPSSTQKRAAERNHPKERPKKRARTQSFDSEADREFDADSGYDAENEFDSEMESDAEYESDDYNPAAYQTVHSDVDAEATNSPITNLTDYVDAAYQADNDFNVITQSDSSSVYAFRDGDAVAGLPPKEDGDTSVEHIARPHGRGSEANDLWSSWDNQVGVDDFSGPLPSEVDAKAAQTPEKTTYQKYPQTYSSYGSSYEKSPGTQDDSPLPPIHHSDPSQTVNSIHLLSPPASFEDQALPPVTDDATQPMLSTNVEPDASFAMGQMPDLAAYVQYHASTEVFSGPFDMSDGGRSDYPALPQPDFLQQSYMPSDNLQPHLNFYNDEHTGYDFHPITTGDLGAQYHQELIGEHSGFMAPVEPTMDFLNQTFHAGDSSDTFDSSPVSYSTPASGAFDPYLLYQSDLSPENPGRYAFPGVNAGLGLNMPTLSFEPNVSYSVNPWVQNEDLM